MTRFNYLSEPRRASFALRFGAIAVDNRIRGPLSALLITVFLTAALSVVQLNRLRTAQNAYARASIALIADEPAVREIDALRVVVSRQTQVARAAAEGRRASLVQVNDLTWIGNRLPAQASLRALRYDDGTYSLEGTSDRVSGVGTVMDALRDAEHAAVPQLVSLQDDGSAAATHVRYTLHVGGITR